jgi:hypothetical protein
MREIVLMNPSKMTERKLRWQADVDGVKFYLYISQARVPAPRPLCIRVELYRVVERAPKRRSQRRKLADSSGLRQPISAVVVKVEEHTETVRYWPMGAPDEWEIGEPYIPYGLLEPRIPERLRLDVHWDWSAGTWADG